MPERRGLILVGKPPYKLQNMGRFILGLVVACGFFGCRERVPEPAAKARAAKAAKTTAGSSKPTVATTAAPSASSGLSEDACRSSDACLADGQCSFYEGRCMAQFGSDCFRSLACKNTGRCRVLDGKCVK